MRKNILHRGEMLMASWAIGLYLKESPEVQKVIRDMIVIVESPIADDHERELALDTLSEAMIHMPKGV